MRRPMSSKVGWHGATLIAPMAMSPARPSPLAPATRRARAWLVAALVLLVLAQALGQMHRALHVPGMLVGQPELRQATLAHGHAHGQHWVQDLFAGHGDADCRLLDALAHPACPAAPLLVLPMQLGAPLLAAARSDFVARWAALFDARGPPAFR